MNKIGKILEKLIRDSKQSREWRTFVFCLAAVVVFTTTYALILPAITVEKNTTDSVGGLVVEEADPGSTVAGAEASGDVHTVEAENEVSGEAVQVEAAGTAEAVEEVREPVNGEVLTVGDKKIMTLTGEEFDVVVSSDLYAGVSDGTVLSVRGISDANVAKSYSDRISDELLKLFVDTKSTEILYRLVFTDTDFVEYTPEGYFDVEFIFHNNTVSSDGEIIYAPRFNGEKVYAAIYDYLTDEMILAEKNGDRYETPVISLDEYGFITSITLKGLDFYEYSDVITLVGGPVNEELKRAAEKAESSAAAENGTESTAGKTESADAKTASAENFSYSVDGKVYDFTLPGGGFVSFRHLVEVLGIAAETEAEQVSEISLDAGMVQEEETVLADHTEAINNSGKFVADVEKVEFSNPALVWVGKVDEETTVGSLKEANGLTITYSADLTTEQIAETNAQLVEAGDWALISIQPFQSNEVLTVTMKNGEVFTIQVTDDQISTRVISASGETYLISVIYDNNARIPEGSELKVVEVLPESQIDPENQLSYTGTYEGYLKATENVLNKNEKVTFARFFDITIVNNGQTIQPSAPVQVKIELADELTDDIKAVHFVHEDPAAEVKSAGVPESDAASYEEAVSEKAVLLNADLVAAEELKNAVTFGAEGFSVYGIVETDNVKVSTITATTTDGASVEITGRLPKGAEASITPVALTTDELVSYYGESVINAVDNIVVYDICILVDGEEWEPDETVSVIIKSPAIETKESNEEVTVTHLIDEDMSAEKMDTELTDDGSISFETEGFSLWGLYTFTVDFYFGEQEYHMPGNTQMLLSELFEKLEIESPISDVINVTFSDENLLQIEKNENDWTLTSLLPFDTDENLQVELADGTILTILTKDKLSYPTYTYESEWLQPYVGTFREFGHIDIFGGGNGIACMSRDNQVNEENWADRAKGAANNNTSTNYTYDQWTKGSWGGGTSFLNDRFDEDYSYVNTSSPKLYFKFDKINGKANGNDQNGAPLVGESGVFKSGSSAVITWDSPVGDEDTKTIRQAYFSFGYQATNNVSYTLDLYGPKGGRTQVTINTSTRTTDTSRAGNDNIGTSWAYLTFNASNFVKDQGFGTYTLVATIQPATSGNFSLIDMGWSIYGVLEDEAVPYAAVVGMIEEKTINPSLTPVVNFEEPVKVAGSGKVWFNVQGGEAKSPVRNTDADYLEVRTGTNTYRSFGSGGAYGGDITIESIKPSATSDPWYYNDIAKPNHEQTAPPGLTNFDNCFSFGLCQYSGMTDSYVYGVRKRMEYGTDVFGSMMLLTEVNTSPVTVSLKELDLDGNGVTSQLPSSGKSETFHFEVAALNDAPPPERTEYTANFQGGETDKDQLEILLGPFGFNSPGIYQYEIREIPGSSPYWSYDSRTLLLTLTVTLNTDATLDVASKLTVKDPENGESEEPVFINQYSLPVCLRLTKKNTDGQTLSGAVFELTAEGESSVYSDRSCETAATSLTTDSKGELVFYGLRKEKTYTLKETTAPNGYILDDTEITIKFDEGKNKWVYIVNGKTSYLTSSVAEDDIGAIGTLKIERTDKRQVMDIGVLKVDETNVARTLPGAEFELTRSDTANGTYERYTVDTAHATNGVYTSGADGRFTMTLPEGYYKLTEVSPPAGYITLQSEIPFQVVDQKGDKVVISDTNYVSLLTNQNTILIKNPYGDALPLTGGTGTQPYTLGGLALIVTVALMYGFRMRRRERRLH